MGTSRELWEQVRQTQGRARRLKERSREILAVSMRLAVQVSHLEARRRLTLTAIFGGLVEEVPRAFLSQVDYGADGRIRATFLCLAVRDPELLMRLANLPPGQLVQATVRRGRTTGSWLETCEPLEPEGHSLSDLLSAAGLIPA